MLEGRYLFLLFTCNIDKSGKFPNCKKFGIILQEHTMNDRLLHDAMYLIIFPYKNSISYSISYFYSAYFKTSKI